MIKILKNTEENKSIVELKNIEKGCWIDLVKPTEKETTSKKEEATSKEETTTEPESTSKEIETTSKQGALSVGI